MGKRGGETYTKCQEDVNAIWDGEREGARARDILEGSIAGREKQIQDKHYQRGGVNSNNNNAAPPPNGKPKEGDAGYNDYMRQLRS